MTPQAIAETLKREMLAGRLTPGADLHQADLAARFGVSRIPVRDALALLAAESLVTIRPNRGATVTRLDAAGLAELFHLRLLLESDCLAAAIPRAGPADHAEIDYQLKRSTLEAGRPGWAASDWDFHRALYTPAGRPLMIGMIGALRQRCQVHIAGYDGLIAETGAWLDDHAALVTAVLARDTPDALVILSRHLGSARDLLLDVMKAEPPA